MRKILATLTASAAFAVGALTFAAPAGADSNDLPRHWTPYAETAAEVVVSGISEFDGFAPECVVDAIQGEFKSPRNFVRHAERHDAPERFTRIALVVVTTCGGGSVG